MRKKEDKDTRYFLDLDLKIGKILAWGYDNKHKLAVQKQTVPRHHRVYLTKGQYNKLERAVNEAKS